MAEIINIIGNPIHKNINIRSAKFILVPPKINPFVLYDTYYLCAIYGQ